MLLRPLPLPQQRGENKESLATIGLDVMHHEKEEKRKAHVGGHCRKALRKQLRVGVNGGEAQHSW